jgi:endonuclease/exonuclease/phosphatase (EEP) superfamily protein YafD
MLKQWISRVTLAAAVAVLAACASVPADDRLLSPQFDGSVGALPQKCSATRVATEPLAVRAGFDTKRDAESLRVVSWNLHKGADAGWETDLAAYAAASDLVLLQEAVLSDAVRNVLERAGHEWMMAGAFSWKGQERGVLVAARARAFDGCALRAFEPLFPVPKSALVARYRLPGGAALAVANLHGVNFSLGLGRFREQIEAVAVELARHQGPVILAGDFNTWSEARHEVLADAASRLGLVSVLIDGPDGRRLALGQALDHFYFRGFRLVRAIAPTVKTSDNNPILVELDLR